MINYKSLFFVLLTILVVGVGIGCWTTNVTSNVSQGSVEGCGIAYSTNDLYFKADNSLLFRFRFIYIADSLNEATPNYDSIINNINAFYRNADIQFSNDTSDNLFVVNPDIKDDMPSFIKYHMKNWKNDSLITMYIYGNDQENYSDDLKNIAGSAGGLGCNFFAIKRDYVYKSTVLHEIGHCFFLMHTSEPDPTEKGLDLMYGDKICDLIKSDPVEFSKYDSCIARNSIGAFSTEEVNEVICNIMSYSYMPCRKCLTKNQIARMRFYIHESPTMRMALKAVE